MPYSILIAVEPYGSLPFFLHSLSTDDAKLYSLWFNLPDYLARDGGL